MTRLAAELGISISEVFRRALIELAAVTEVQRDRERAEREEGERLLQRVHEAGISFDFPGKGEPTVETHVSRRVIAKWEGNTFQDIGGRLVVARRRLDGEVEIGYLDGEGEPPAPDVAKFFEERVLV